MSELIMRFPDLVSSDRGVFSPAVMARPRADGRWEGWLEFVETETNPAATLTTGIETRQHDRVALERWASGLTPIYVEGALVRTRALQPQPPSSERLAALRGLVAALDRRIPQLHRVDERDLAIDATRLRAVAMQRIDAANKPGAERFAVAGQVGQDGAGTRAMGRRDHAAIGRSAARRIKRTVNERRGGRVTAPLPAIRRRAPRHEG